MSGRSQQPDAADIVIVGAGQAGMQVAQSLHDMGFAGSVVLIGEEAGQPYQRPPLSKAVLMGAADLDTVTTHPADWFAGRNVEYRSGVLVAAIHRARRRLELADGGILDYGRLVLATGARNRVLDVLDPGIAGLHYLRTHEEAVALRDTLSKATSVAIVGAGFLGLEAAGCAAALGKAVTVIDVAERALARAVSPAVSAAVEQHHRDAGTRFLFGQRVEGCVATGRHIELQLDHHGTVTADAVLVAVGVVPNDELAGGAGLATGNGITVDERLRTADPAIWALGDCASFHDARRGASLRIESVQNAIDQGKHVAGQLIGQDAAYDRVPLFWSDQNGLRLQMAGIASPGDLTATRGNADTGGFSVFHTSGDRLSAVESVNDPRGHMLARKLLAARAVIPAAALGDPACDLRSFVGSGAPAAGRLAAQAGAM